MVRKMHVLLRDRGVRHEEGRVCLGVALQKEPPLLTLSLFGKQEYNIRQIVEVAFVIGDQLLSQDIHCCSCRKKSNSGGAGCTHCTCHDCSAYLTTTFVLIATDTTNKDAWLLSNLQEGTLPCSLCYYMAI